MFMRSLWAPIMDSRMLKAPVLELWVGSLWAQKVANPLKVDLPLECGASWMRPQPHGWQVPRRSYTARWCLRQRSMQHFYSMALQQASAFFDVLQNLLSTGFEIERAQILLDSRVVEDVAWPSLANQVSSVLRAAAVPSSECSEHEGHSYNQRLRHLLHSPRHKASITETEAV